MKSNDAPIGLLLAQTAKAVSREFDNALAAEGGSLPVWLVLLALTGRDRRLQSDLLQFIGIQGPTLTHHLNAMEKNGLIVRKRLPENRRMHEVELTDRGRALFQRLRKAAEGYDAVLRSGFTAKEAETLRALLRRLGANATPPKP